MNLLIALLITWQLGMTVKQAQEKCPNPLMRLYEKVHLDTHFACDDGVNTTVLIFDVGKLVAILDLRYYARGK